MKHTPLTAEQIERIVERSVGTGQAYDVHALVIEIERLKNGNFTPEEFQNLCHNATGCTRAEFEAGCKAYQDKLFGISNENS